MSLTPEVIHELGEVSLGMVWQNGVPPNITAVQLAGDLLDRLKSNITSYNGFPILEIMRNSTFNATLDDHHAEEVLQKMTMMPMDIMHGVAAGWIIMILISGPMLALRLYSRIRYSGGLRKDDWCLIIAWLVATQNSAEDIWLMIYQNWGSHGWNATRSQIRWNYRICTIDDYLFAIFAFFYKAALLIFFHELYPARPFRIAIWCIGIFLLVWAVGLEVFIYYKCTPFKIWENPFALRCIPAALTLFQMFTILNIVLDLVIFILPCIISYKSTMRMRKRIAIVILMGMGFVVCLASIMRYPTLNHYVNSTDVHWRSIDITTWSLLEPHLAITCASVPAVRKLVLNLMPRIKSLISPQGSPDNSKKSSSSTKGSTIASAVQPFMHGGKKQPPPGELTKILNMRTDVDDGTVITQAPSGKDESHTRIELTDSKSFKSSDEERGIR